MPVEEMAEIHLHSLLLRAWCSFAPPLGRISPNPSLTLRRLCLTRSTLNLTPSKNAMTSTTAIGAVEIM